MTTVKVSKLSICQCGFPFFNEHVTVGREYKVDRHRSMFVGYKCGGCGIENPARVIWTEGHGDAGFMPEQVFDL